MTFIPPEHFVGPEDLCRKCIMVIIIDDRFLIKYINVYNAGFMMVHGNNSSRAGCFVVSWTREAWLSQPPPREALSLTTASPPQAWLEAGGGWAFPHLSLEPGR